MENLTKMDDEQGVPPWLRKPADFMSFREAEKPPRFSATCCEACLLEDPAHVGLRSSKEPPWSQTFYGIPRLILIDSYGLVQILIDNVIVNEIEWNWMKWCDEPISSQTKTVSWRAKVNASKSFVNAKLQRDLAEREPDHQITHEICSKNASAISQKNIMIQKDLK